MDEAVSEADKLVGGTLMREALGAMNVELLLAHCTQATNGKPD